MKKPTSTTYTTRAYTPRRAAKRWLENAPEYILDVFDNGGATADRYTVLFGGSLLEPQLLARREVHFLSLSANPSSPAGISMWGEISANYRPSHHRIRWMDLPELVRKHITTRCDNDPL